MLIALLLHLAACLLRLTVPRPSLPLPLTAKWQRQKGRGNRTGRKPLKPGDSTPHPRHPPALNRTFHPHIRPPGPFFRASTPPPFCTTGQRETGRHNAKDKQAYRHAHPTRVTHEYRAIIWVARHSYDDASRSGLWVQGARGGAGWVDQGGDATPAVPATPFPTPGPGATRGGAELRDPNLAPPRSGLLSS
jgi:hypothetical protein